MFLTIDWQSLNAATGVPSLRARDIENIEVIIPGAKEQAAIASTLSDVDALISSLDALIAKKRDIKKAAMQELLTGKRRLPGFGGEWMKVFLHQCLNVRHGKSQKDVESPNGIYPIFGTGGFMGFSKESLSEGPCVLIGRKGTIDKPQFIDEPFWTIDTLFYTEFTLCHFPKFFYYLFLTIDWQSLNTATGVPSLRARDIENIEVSIPGAKEQAAIAAVLSDMDAEIAALEARRGKIRQLKKGMMQELLTGKIRLLPEGSSDDR